MISRRTLIAGVAALPLIPIRAEAAEMWPVTDLTWRYIADRVMGGVSDGQAALSDGALRLTGRVSTANNGGFIQARADVEGTAFAQSTGLALRVRGNGQRYFIHLRTTASRRPWQFYQAGFDTGADWSDITLPFSAFQPQGGGLSDALSPQDIETVALVAYGRDHQADVSLSALGPA